jgi:hypothetical protein
MFTHPAADILWRIFWLGETKRRVGAILRGGWFLNGATAEILRRIFIGCAQDDIAVVVGLNWVGLGWVG